MRGQRGFTLIELLVGVVVSAAIFLVASNLVASLFGSSTRQKQLETLEQSKNDLQSDIGNNIKWADESISFTDGKLSADGDIYELIDGILYKNSIPLTPGNVYVESFNVTKFSSSVVPTEVQKGIGLTGRYFNAIDFTEYVFDQIDPAIDFDWSSDSPDDRIVTDTFSVRWTGQIETPDSSGEYRFRVQSSDGARLLIDDQLVVDGWKDGSASSVGSITLQGTRRYNITLDYYENQGRANIALYWSHFTFGQELVPVNRLYPSALQSTIEVSINLYHKSAPDVKDTVSIIVSPRSGGVVGAIQPIVTPSPTPTDFLEGSLTPTTSDVPNTPTPTRGRGTGTPRPTEEPGTPTPTTKPLR